MQNLELWDVTVRDLQLKPEQKLALYCYGGDDNNLGSDLFVCSHNLILTNYEANGNIRFHNDLSDVTSPNNSPVNATFLSIPNNLCIGLTNGELYIINESGNNCELAGVSENGLLAMEWSPDQELLVLVTKELTTILMSCTFDPINEVNLLDEEFGEKQFINVGWGKKETQFHGSEGKNSRVKQDVASDPNISADNTVKISWRGDGNLYAIGFNMNNIRCFKVFDREGHLQYTSEKQQGLESNLSWRPSGNVIATTQKLSDKYIVAFFEKNGLKHGGFTIPVDSKTHVQDIAWSCDSEILALQCKNVEQNKQMILLFSSSNYHWYLKQALLFETNIVLSKILWGNAFDAVNNKKLHVFLDNGQLYTYSWIWNINKSLGQTTNDDAIVGVIDGNKVSLTNFRQTIVPPPMSANEIQLDAFINSVTFAPPHIINSDFDSNSFFLCTSNNQLVFYKQVQKFPLMYKECKSFNLENYVFPLQYYNWFWVDCDSVVCVTVENNSYYLIEYTITEDTIIKKSFESLPEAVNRIQSHPINSRILFLQLNNGDIIEYVLGRAMEPLEISFGISCPIFNTILIDNKLYFLGLSNKGNLFVNNTIVMKNVNSISFHTHFLLITTLQHMLLCTELNKTGLTAIMDYQKNESNSIYKRKIERGAKIVITVPNDTKTIFQMPRGNLETIQPRPLSLKIIGECLDSCKYFEAFDLMRKQRINLNLIYDHNPNKFLENVDVFIKTIKNDSWLSLFLSDLENIDVTKTMYSSSYTEKTDESSDKICTKIQRVCGVVTDYLINLSDSDSKIFPLLTSFVKKNTIEDLENALTLIMQLKKQELAGSDLPVGSDEALKYLLYMVDVNRLFDIALGMYDFELVLLIANKSQKDPKEYIPMLNELNNMEDDYKKFTINKYLKRYEKAVQNLVACGDKKYKELKTFVKYNSLYRVALNLFSDKDDIYKQISDDFGHYLKLKKQYTEAGIMYEKAGNIDQAIECFKFALEWELAIKLAHNQPKELLRDLYWELILALKENKRHKEALFILEQFYKNEEETVLYAIENGQYKTAIRLCSQYNRSDLRDQRLLPALLEEYNNLKELIYTNCDKFIQHRDRLRIVRLKKANNPNEVYDLSYDNKDIDLYSDAGSTLASSQSRNSSRTFRSSKNRRKHERKIASLKEGSQYEDVALVMALYSLIISTFDLRLQVKEVNIALCNFDMHKKALSIQTSLDELLKEMKDGFKDIWTNEFLLEAANACIAAQNASEEGCNSVLQGIASMDPQMRIAPLIQDVSWKLEGLYY